MRRYGRQLSRARLEQVLHASRAHADRQLREAASMLGQAEVVVPQMVQGQEKAWETHTARVQQAHEVVSRLLQHLEQPPMRQIFMASVSQLNRLVDSKPGLLEALKATGTAAAETGEGSPGTDASAGAGACAGCSCKRCTATASLGAWPRRRKWHSHVRPRLPAAGAEGLTVAAGELAESYGQILHIMEVLNLMKDDAGVQIQAHLMAAQVQAAKGLDILASIQETARSQSW